MSILGGGASKIILENCIKMIIFGTNKCKGVYLVGINKTPLKILTNMTPITIRKQRKEVTGKDK